LTIQASEGVLSFQPRNRKEAYPCATNRCSTPEETRRALLDAAVKSLIEVGFARTTTLKF
jgi:AcrR family transcriptional regulator